MFKVERLVDRPDLDVAAVTCGQHEAGWSPPETAPDYRLVLVRHGRFRRRVAGRTADLDPSVGYIGVPSDEEHFAHPAGSDVCTSIRLRPALWHTLTPGPAVRARSFYVDGALDLAHRRLLRAAGTGDVEYAVVEHLVTLLSSALRSGLERDPGAGPPGTATSPRHGRTRAAAAGGAAGGAAGAAAGGAARAVSREAADRALVGRAREAIRADDPAAGGLVALAAELGVSPFRLSRAFSTCLGVSLTRYRNRVRVERALDRLEQGADDLARLAAELGFADQAHLCRTMRQHVGHPPSAVRRLLT
ncbi:AraC family transcriptional regulator [Dactylosporangium sp. AC04546]|uniref:helix-turn-helix domain-containing protein n=1 Tax=Dactylosporangium sp. AC04546 TaxID=2862460 RepID=UPI0027DF21F7|nr:AraC family transcriptional regulator [Dactylosporangium sp. AC04546]WVK78667.1 AraC family transcriptional regulator [Dactylosporangium sp. AC04546]